MEIELHEPRSAEEFEMYYDLRWRILRQPWTGDKERAQEEYDYSAIHLTAWYGSRIVGGARLHFLAAEEAQIKGMAVEPDCAGRGIGSMILTGLEVRASRAGVKRIMLHARENALAFYRKNRYQLGQPSYTLFDTVKHWSMHKDL